VAGLDNDHLNHHIWHPCLSDNPDVLVIQESRHKKTGEQKMKYDRHTWTRIAYLTFAIGLAMGHFTTIIGVIVGCGIILLLWLIFAYSDKLERDAETELKKIINNSEI